MSIYENAMRKEAGAREGNRILGGLAGAGIGAGAGYGAYRIAKYLDLV